MQRTTVIWLVLTVIFVLTLSFVVRPPFGVDLVLAQANQAGSGEIQSIAWSPDGSIIAVGQGYYRCNSEHRENYTIKLIDAATGMLIDELRYHSCTVRSLDWNSDGTKLISTGGADADGKGVVWDMNLRQRITVSQPYSMPGRLIDRWSPDNTRVVSVAEATSTVIVWDPATGETILSIPDGAAASAAWSPDGLQIITGSSQLVIWNATTAEEVATFTAPGGPSTAMALEWATDNSRIFSAGSDGRIHVWDGETKAYVRTLEGHSSSIHEIALSPDNTRLASASLDGTVRIWNAETGDLLETLALPSDAYAVAWSPDGTKIAYGGAGLSGNPPQVQIVDAPVIAPAPEATQEDILDIATSAVSALAWSPSGEQLAILRGTNGPSCTPGNKAPHELDLMTIATNRIQTQPLSDNVCEVGDVAFSFDDAYLITRSSAGRIHIVSAENLNILHIQETMAVGNGLKTSPVDFRYIMLGGGTSATIHNFDVASEDVLTLTGGVLVYANDHTGTIRDADWDPTGNMMATGSDDTTLAIWDLVQDVLISRINEPNGQAIERVAWSQEGDLIAFSNQLGEISILDVTSQNILFNFSAHNERINRLDWSPDGTRLATASEDGTVKVWNVETGTLLETLTYPGPVYALDWSPDGTKIAYGGADFSGSLPQIQIVDAPVTEAMFEAMLEAEAERNRVSCLSDHARPARLAINEEVEVVEDGADLRLRVSPDLSSTVLQTMAGGTLVTIVGGPACSGGYRWWQVQLSDGAVGWAVEADSSDYFLQPSDS